MLQHVVLNLILTYLAGELVGVSSDGTIKWADLISRWNARVLMLIPSKFLQGWAQALGDSVITLFQKLLTDKADVLALAKDLAAADWADSIALLKRMVLDNWKPTDAVGKELFALIFAGTTVAGAADHPTVVPVKGGPAGGIAAPALVAASDTPPDGPPSSGDKEDVA